jgi:hypothetical protein
MSLIWNREGVCCAAAGGGSDCRKLRLAEYAAAKFADTVIIS